MKAAFLSPPGSRSGLPLQSHFFEMRVRSSAPIYMIFVLCSSSSLSIIPTDRRIHQCAIPSPSFSITPLMCSSLSTDKNKSGSLIGRCIFFGFRPQCSACAFLWAKLGFMIFFLQIYRPINVGKSDKKWPNMHILALQMWSSGVVHLWV